MLHRDMIRFARLTWRGSWGHGWTQPAMFRLLLSSRRYQRAHDGFLRSFTVIPSQGQVLQRDLYHALHVPHLRLARSSLQTQPRRATLYAPYKFAPHRTLVSAKLDERVTHLFVCATPHSAMPANRALDVATAKNALKSRALCQGRLRVG